jgi:hypothetical protein
MNATDTEFSGYLEDLCQAREHNEHCCTHSRGFSVAASFITNAKLTDHCTIGLALARAWLCVCITERERERRKREERERTSAVKYPRLHPVT